MVLRKPRKIWGHTVYLAAARSEKGLMALVCQADPEHAVQDYLERWQIEMVQTQMTKWYLRTFFTNGNDVPNLYLFIINYDPVNQEF